MLADRGIYISLSLYLTHILYIYTYIQSIYLYMYFLDKYSIPESSQLTGYQFLCYNSTAFLLFLYRSPSAVRPADANK